jgi:hypothetical protein
MFKKKKLMRFFRYIIPISHSIIKYTPVIQNEPYFLIPIMLMKLGLKYKVAILIIAFLL